ncbi:hydroxymethylglutaryl-CoA synthase [Latilactobacillus sakei]|uniref:hydroxymethylglutaryl-CoA synthase n=2 Tax=Latilactobacillus sakei TaxID=1599 RepID=UPI00077C77F6|nr:hydroxymethylglutaryl-CoA synthase [Latilactobacillus sakei]AST84031.1 hydroxymethylglutaryl-CoA synthase [Latilactobacillus sakei]MCB4409373.1 hydroxymethylglutaryl-CoA synthase [Latilactobacillus sakei]MDB1553400.1 hydroxymethylglutaryl-CoA synthase [Latilactobacillus sakei]MDM5043666.1 hydroxymethylglutaryl-CoA synthase [Latilactobacillus sakei]QGL60112.1 hydroxymethylglutaryl-CoA synthase [Latilactobacillus sakei]
MQIGIDKLGLFTPNTYLDLVMLANARGVDPDKFTIGIGQDQMAIAPLSQDSVTMGANAALDLLEGESRDNISLLILGTESGIDQSKAGAIYIQRLLGLSNARTFEIKEACYGATAGLMTAYDYVAAHPDQKALVIGSDIARYGLETPGEVTQGAGAVAMLVSAQPRLMVLEPETSIHSEDIQDFWRPNYSKEAFARGKYSTEQYIEFFQKTWADYRAKTGRTIADFKALAFHLPYTKMGLKALRTILDEGSETQQAQLLERYAESTLYSRQIGNIYTGALYLGFLSLLEHSTNLEAGDRIGLFSYGSGAVSEFFTGILQPGFEKQLAKQKHADLLANRRQLTMVEYETQFQTELPEDGSEYEIDLTMDNAPIILKGVKDHERIYMTR